MKTFLSSSTQSVSDTSIKIITDFRATGQVERAPHSTQLYFSAPSNALGQSTLVFEDVASWDDYLSSRDEIDTWKIEDKASGKIIYKHRYVDGEIEQVNSEYALNLILSQEYEGKWKIKYIGPQADDKPSQYMLAESGYWSTQFKRFDSKAALLETYQQTVADTSFSRQLYSYGLSALTLAATGIMGYYASSSLTTESQDNASPNLFNNFLTTSSLGSLTTATTTAAITYGFTVANGHSEQAQSHALLMGLSSFLPIVQANDSTSSFANDDVTSTQLAVTSAFRSKRATGNIDNEFMINTYTVNSQDTPIVSSFSNGNFIIVWESAGQDSSGYGTFMVNYLMRLAPKLGCEFQANTYVTNDQLAPTVAVLNNNNFVVVWESNGHTRRFTIVVLLASYITLMAQKLVVNLLLIPRR
jgi:hypothetical protein